MMMMCLGREGKEDQSTRALLRLERTMNLLCHGRGREGGRGGMTYAYYSDGTIYTDQQ